MLVPPRELLLPQLKRQTTAMVVGDLIYSFSLPTDTESCGMWVESTLGATGRLAVRWPGVSRLGRAIVTRHEERPHDEFNIWPPPVQMMGDGTYLILTSIVGTAIYCFDPWVALLGTTPPIRLPGNHWRCWGTRLADEEKRPADYLNMVVGIRPLKKS